MNDPKLHHYVPQFYLRRFADAKGRLWVWDRDQDRTFTVKPDGVAAEANFYFLDELAADGHDPFLLEKQFSHLESETALITEQWLSWLRELDYGDTIPIPDENRELISLYIALQFYRTADAREILAIFGEKTEGRSLTAAQKRDLHVYMLWSSGIVQTLAARIQSSIWIFGRNETKVPFITSDNPIAFRTGDNSIWLKTGMWTPGTYSVTPLAPDIVMYCHPRELLFERLSYLDRCLSPVRFTEDMVVSENGGQAFMAYRFVFSRQNEFSAERSFAKTIGTDAYQDFWERRTASNE